MTKSTKTLENPFGAQTVVKQDLLLFPLALLYNFFSGLIIILILSVIYGIHNQEVPEHIYNQWNTIMMDTANVAVLVTFYLMHKQYLMPIVKRQLGAIKKYWLLIVLAVIVLNVGDTMISYVFEHHLGALQSENQLAIIEVFEHKWLWPFLFFGIVIIGPLTEELLYRHVLIHELGKKITTFGASVISIVLFGAAHMMMAHSILEIMPYLFAGLVFVVTYVLARKNLVAVFLVHSLSNLIAYIDIMLPHLR